MVGWSLVITILVKIMSVRFMFFLCMYNVVWPRSCNILFFFCSRKESKTSSKMGTELDKALSLEIDNFSERTNVMKSVIFSSGGCNW